MKRTNLFSLIAVGGASLVAFACGTESVGIDESEADDDFIDRGR